MATGNTFRCFDPMSTNPFAAYCSIPSIATSDSLHTTPAAVAAGAPAIAQPSFRRRRRDHPCGYCDRRFSTGGGCTRHEAFCPVRNSAIRREIKKLRRENQAIKTQLDEENAVITPLKMDNQDMSARLDNARAAITPLKIEFNELIAEYDRELAALESVMSQT